MLLRQLRLIAHFLICSACIVDIVEIRTFSIAKILMVDTVKILHEAKSPKKCIYHNFAGIHSVLPGFHSILSCVEVRFVFVPSSAHILKGKKYHFWIFFSLRDFIL